MKLTDDPIPALEGMVGDITICATGAKYPRLRGITLTQPLHANGDDDDTIMIELDDLDEFISKLQEVRKFYTENPKVMK